MVPLLLGPVFLLSFPACESGDGETGEANSVVSGNVVSFDMVSFRHAPLPATSPWQRWGRAVWDLVVSPAWAAVQWGVEVELEGTGLKRTTNNDGTFAIDGVSAGAHRLVFRYNDLVASSPIQVGSGVRVELSDITIAADGTVRIAGTNIVYLVPPAPDVAGLCNYSLAPHEKPDGTPAATWGPIEIFQSGDALSGTMDGAAFTGSLSGNSFTIKGRLYTGVTITGTVGTNQVMSGTARFDDGSAPAAWSTWGCQP
jgi:hypothetical protein